MRPSLAEQQQREGVEQVEGRGLAEEVDRQRGVAAAAQDRQQRGDEDLATEQDDDEPPRDDVAHGQAEQRRQDVEAVGRRVEQLAQRRDLAVAAGDLAVEVVGEAGDHQQHQGPAVVVGQDQPEEERHAEQPQRGEHVGHGQDAVGRAVLTHTRLERSRPARLSLDRHEPDPLPARATHASLRDMRRSPVDPPRGGALARRRCS